MANPIYSGYVLEVLTNGEHDYFINMVMEKPLKKFLTTTAAQKREGKSYRWVAVNVVNKEVDNG